MPRALSEAYQAALAAETVRPFYLFEGTFTTGTLRYWSGSFDLNWGGQTWLGNGVFLGLSSIRENSKTESDGLDIILSCAPSSVVSLALNSVRQDAKGKLWLGLFDANWAIIADPCLLFVGGLDVPKISDGGDQLTLTLAYESALILLKEAKNVRYTDAHQKQMFPGDRGFEFLISMIEWSGYWGQEATK